MSIYNYEEAFGAYDKTSRAMRTAIDTWFSMYYDDTSNEQSDSCQKIAYTVVNKLVRTVFGEYRFLTSDPVVTKILQALDPVRKEAVQLALLGGECYIKPCIESDGFSFMRIPRNNVLIFARNSAGVPTDVGTVEKSVWGNSYYTLLERRTVDEKGYLTIQNQLYCSSNAQQLGHAVALEQCPQYASLSRKYRYPQPIGSVGLICVKTPIINCVDGSCDGVSVFAPAVGLIRNINRNEAQMNGEFSRGESRVFASSDLLGKNAFGGKELTENLFVGLDEDPERVGLTIFSPVLREKAFLSRKHEYLRNIESIIGLKRGMLSDANIEDRTATEIASSAGDYSLTVMDFQQMWEKAVCEVVAICCTLAKLYKLPLPRDTQVSFDWGNGVLYDEDKTWQAYQQMVASGLLKPEIALGWRFNMPTQTQQECEAVRERYMPKTV